MSKQMELPHNGTPTSRAAAESKRDAELQRAQVLAFITSQGSYGATDLEIQAATGIKGDSERPRRGELEGTDKLPTLICPLVQLGKPVTRKTPSGRQAQVYVITGLGIAQALSGVIVKAWDERAKS